jgi:hypothetical protein
MKFIKLIKFSYAETSHTQVSLRELFFSRCSLKVEIDGITYFFSIVSAPGTLKNRGEPEGFYLITASGTYPFNLWTGGISRSGLTIELNEAQVQEVKEFLDDMDSDILVI